MWWPDGVLVKEFDSRLESSLVRLSAVSLQGHSKVYKHLQCLRKMPCKKYVNAKNLQKFIKTFAHFCNFASFCFIVHVRAALSSLSKA